MNEVLGYFITWNTYGTWLPGDQRGWRKRGQGTLDPRPRLEAWCKDQMVASPVLLRDNDRETVHQACEEHCNVRGWDLMAVNARTNHVHAVVAALAKPKLVLDQLKANCTRKLRLQVDPLLRDRTWARGGDCEILDTEEDRYNAIRYVKEGQ